MKRILLLVPLLYCSYVHGESDKFSIESTEGFEQAAPTPPQQPEEEKPKASYEEMATYRSAIHNAVLANFTKSERFKGKQCEIRIHFNEQGKLRYENQSIKIIKGDNELCMAAGLAIENTAFPQPKSIDVHNEFKTVFIYFYSNDFLMKSHNKYLGSPWKFLE